MAAPRARTHPVISQLEEAIGGEAIARGSTARAFLTGRIAKGVEPVVVSASSAAEVSRALAVTSAANVAVHIAGSSSRGMKWDRLRAGTSVILDLAKLDAVLSVDEVSLTVTTQTGITFAALERALQRRGYSLGFVLGGYAEQVSVGGMLATGLPPLASPARGSFASHVVNVSWVMPDGTPVRTRITPRAATGPDLDALVLGGRGLLGVITEATLRIHREPEEKQLMGFGFKTVPDAILTLAEVVGAGLLPLSAGLWPVPGKDRGARLAVLYGGSAEWRRAVSAAAKKAFKDLGARVDPKPDESWFAHVGAAAARVGGTQEPIWASGGFHALARAAATPPLRAADSGFGIPCFGPRGGLAVASLEGPGAEARARAFAEAGCAVLRGPAQELAPLGTASRAVLARLKATLDPSNLLNPGNLDG